MIIPCRKWDASASGSHWKINRGKRLSNILQAILPSKCRCSDGFQNNYTLHVNQNYPSIYGPICNPLLLIQDLEWHLNSKVPDVWSWPLETPPTSFLICLLVIGSRGLSESYYFFFNLIIYLTLSMQSHLITLILLFSWKNTVDYVLNVD